MNYFIYLTTKLIWNKTGISGLTRMRNILFFPSIYQKIDMFNIFINGYIEWNLGY